ncbi:unnamed protein product [Clonostachys rosea]|uniref:Zn(2)-C6 fungal-type domain-containing protein n=1 Tax=Bionectria ochroleuca TaxID=29856 RepID=A0ABY6U154_BIOOC|nr:unnamed protein product [Clonostachys rosea]
MELHSHTTPHLNPSEVSRSQQTFEPSTRPAPHDSPTPPDLSGSQGPTTTDGHEAVQNIEADRPAPDPRIKSKTRTRTGCLVCRARKVKCDEKRPSCQKCTKQGRPCVYRTPDPRGWPQIFNGSSGEYVSSSEDQMSITAGASPTLWQAGNISDKLHSPIQSLLDPNNCRDLATPSDLSHAETQSEDPNLCLPSNAQPEGVLPATALTKDAPMYPGPDGQDQESDPNFGASSLERFQRTSQVISLTLSLDKFVTYEVPTEASFAYFTDELDCSFLSSFDSLGWKRIKQSIAQLGAQEVSVARCILSTQALYRTQVDRLPTEYAMSLYQAAISSFQFVLDNGNIDFDIILIDAFLLLLSQLILPNRDNPTFTWLDPVLISRLDVWLKTGHKSPMSLRICTWLQILDTVAKRGGSPSLLPDSIFDHLTESISEVPSISSLDTSLDPGDTLYDTISTPLYAFYLKVQRVSNRVADVSHYRRSRTTPGDQAEVNGILTGLKDTMYSLWDNRPGPLRLQPREIREHFNFAIAEPTVVLAGVCLAAYFAELIVFGRTLGDPIFPSIESRHAMAQIRGYVDGDWVSSSGGALNPGYLRALFLYGVECFEKDESRWAAERLRQIGNPLSRGNFFASFIELHGEAQRAQRRRVTMKYFCRQNFGVPLPFM